jgi:hypothetical protein
MRIDEVLCALVYRRSFRERFRAGERAELGIDPADEADLAAIDLGELDRTADLTCRTLLEASHRGVGSLRDAFPRSIRAYCTVRDETELPFDFADSQAFAGFGRDAPGPPMEAVFGDFLETALDAQWQPVVREERALAVLRALVVTPSPAFAIPDWVRAGPAGHYAVVRRAEAPLLVAALNGRLVTGPVTPLTAGILEGDAVEAAAVRAELRAMGLLS